MNVIFMRPKLDLNNAVSMVPTTQRSERVLAELKQGVYRVTIKADRNWKLHDKYFATLNTVWENQEQFASADELREATLIEIGYTQLRERLDGTRYYVAASMAGGRMLKGWTIDRIYERSLDAWAKHFGYDPSDA